MLEGVGGIPTALCCINVYCLVGTLYYTRGSRFCRRWFRSRGWRGWEGEGGCKSYYSVDGSKGNEETYPVCLAVLIGYSVWQMLTLGAT